MPYDRTFADICSLVKHTRATFQSCSIVTLLHGQPPNRVNDLSVAPENISQRQAPDSADASRYD